jgi:hypothetical protein
MPAGPALPDPDRPHAVDVEVTWPGRVWVDAEQLGPRPPHAIDVEELDPETGLPVDEPSA